MLMSSGDVLFLFSFLFSYCLDWADQEEDWIINIGFVPRLFSTLVLHPKPLNLVFLQLHRRRPKAAPLLSSPSPSIEKMAPLTHFLAAATLAGLGAAAPTARDNVKVGSTTLHQVRNNNYTFNGAVSVYKTYLKFGAAIPEHLQAAVDNTGLISKRTSGSVVTSPIDSSDDAYSIPVSIGTPAQVLNLDLDTGSSDLWVFSSLTASSEVDGQNIYTPSKSSTSKLVSGATWKVRYGDESTSSGVIYTDKVTVGGVTTSSQAVEVAKTVSSSFTSDSSIDGLIGLGFDSLNSAKPSAVPTFFDNIVGDLDSPVFTADLKHNKGTYCTPRLHK